MLKYWALERAFFTIFEGIDAMPQDELLRAIAALGEYALQDEKKYEVGNRDEYLWEPAKALRYFAYRMFYRGRFDWLSEVYAKAALHVLDNMDWRALKADSLNASQDPIGLRSLKPRGYTFPIADTKMVYGCLRLVLKLPENNIIKYTKECVEARRAGEAHKKIDSIPYVGDKLACLYLRDVAFLYELLKVAEGSDQVECFLPIDTWVRQFCEKLGIVASAQIESRTVKKGIIDKCCEISPTISPICFDHGLWVISQIRYAVKNLEMIDGTVNQLSVIRDSRILEG